MGIFYLKSDFSQTISIIQEEQCGGRSGGLQRPTARMLLHRATYCARKALSRARAPSSLEAAHTRTEGGERERGNRVRVRGVPRHCDVIFRNINRTLFKIIFKVFDIDLIQGKHISYI